MSRRRHGHHCCDGIFPANCSPDMYDKAENSVVIQIYKGGRDDISLLEVQLHRQSGRSKALSWH